MSLDDCKGAGWAIRELMRLAQADIDSGNAKAATQKWKTANPAKVTIGWFKRRLLRGEFRKRV